MKNTKHTLLQNFFSKDDTTFYRKKKETEKINVNAKSIIPPSSSSFSFTSSLWN